MSGKKIKLIMPVYNTEQYLEEALESIVAQSIGFTRNIELYLIDDASADKSLDICRKFQKRFPENINVTHFEENKGVSAARNYGIELVKEENDVIVGFVDSDDKLAPDFVKQVASYFAEHEDINFATTRIWYFDAIEKEHRLNWRFENKDVVDIKKDYTFPHYYIGGAFVRRSALEHLHFDEGMSFWEDALAVNQVILQEGKYGLIRGAIYYYRKRPDESSLVNQAWKNEERYTTFLEQGYMRLMDYCKKKKHRVIPYIQFVVAYHVRGFMKKSKKDIVGEVLETDEDLADFRDRLQVVLKRISEKVIIQVPTTLPIMESMLSIRKGRQVRAKRVYKDGDCLFVYKGKIFARMSERKVRLYYIMDTPGYEGMWRGRFLSPVYAMKRDDYIFAEHDGQRVESQEYRCRRQLFILGKRYRCWFHAGFVINIPKEWKSARFGIYIAEFGKDVLMNEIVFDEVEQVFLGKASEPTYDQELD